MNKIAISIVMLISCLIAQAQAWPQTTTTTMPGTRWWWMGSAVDSVNLSENLAEYARTGIRTVEITPIYGVQGNDANEIPYLSPKWMHMLNIVQSIATTNDMQVDMNQGTGWPFGGPEVTLDEGACKVVFVVDTISAGANPSKPVPQKDADIATLIATSQRLLPSGETEVIRAYQSRTRQKVKRAAPGGEGLVLDHFDSKAVGNYLLKFDKAFRENNIPYPATFFNDSYEVYNANWTPMLLEEFERRRGYRLQDNLPQLLGLVEDDNQVLCDYRETLAELLLENFTEQWVDWAHQRGIMVRNQAHGSPANLIDLYAAVDIPEIEGFGLSEFGIKGLRTDSGYTRKNDSDVSMLKYASSAAHITGKPLTSSETFTWLTEHFRTSLSQMKPDLDLMFTCGVNRVFFHGTTYSPLDDEWPGWKFYASVDISPTNTIWRDAPAMLDYIGRCQSFLQSGQPDNDLLVYLPIRDMWHKRHTEGEKGLLMSFEIHKMQKLAPDFISCVMQIDSLGYDCDYISDRYLLGTHVSDGKIVTEGGATYRALIIPGTGKLTPRLQTHIDSLRADGAIVMYGIDADRLRESATPETMRYKHGLRAIRRADVDGYHYFIANLSPNDVDATIPLSVEYTDAVWFDPLDGKIYPAEIDNEGIVTHMKSGESRILRLYDHIVGHSSLVPAPKYGDGSVIDISLRPWTLTTLTDSPREYALDSLTAWTDMNDTYLNTFAGTAAYETEIEIPQDHAEYQWDIDLGDLRESAKVYVNGQLMGTVWAVPFTLDISKGLQPGINKLSIEVTNLPANKIADMDRQGVPWRKFKEINIVDINYKKTSYADWTTMPSGLNSTVKIICR